jgi:colanic acid/amylovoran biosynthesis protein
MKNNILIIPGNTDLNRGDQTLVWESIRLIDDILENVNVFLYNSGANKEETQLQKAQTSLLGYQFVDRILLHPKVKSKKNKIEINYSLKTKITWGIISIWDLVVTLLLLSKIPCINKIGSVFLSKSQQETLKVFRNLQLLVVKGGGFLHSYGKIRDFYVMYYFLFDIFLAKRLGIKVVVLPNSIGPLKNRLARWITKKALTNIEFISVREDVSASFMKTNLNFDAKVYPDLGFYQKSEIFDIELYLNNKGFRFSDVNIAITLRPYRFDGKNVADQLYQKYIAAISKFISEQIHLGRRISLIAHTLGPSAHEDDRLALKEVLENLEESERNEILYMEDKELNCRQLQFLYSNYNYLIGTRFHSVIFALNEKIPSIAIAYGGNKSFGIMKDIGIQDFVIGIDEINSEWLNNQFEKLVVNKQDYLDKLNLYEKQILQKGNDLIQDIKLALKS